jgi:hypothetical protein
VLVIRFFRSAWTVVLPLLAIILIAPLLLLSGQIEERRLLLAVNLTVPLILLGNVMYIVFFHSRSRWPNTTWGQRFVRLFSFHE